MIRINELFFTPAKAKAFIHSTLRDFPAKDYGTRLTTRRSRCGLYVEVNGSRFA